MDKITAFNKVKDQLISVFNLKPDSITPDKKLDDDLNLDSLDMVDLVISLNDQGSQLLTREIEPSLFKKACTVQDVADILLPYFSAK